jgi:signal transduction histidine kinase
MIGAMLDITERKRAEEALYRKNERLHFLSEAAERLLSAQVPEVTVRALFDRLAGQMGLDVYFNYLVDDSGKALRLDSCAGVSEEVAQGIGRLEMGQAVCGTVAQERRAIEAKDVQHCEDAKTELIRGLGIQTYACFPLLAGEHLLGTLSFGSRQRQEFSPEELQLLRTVSCYVAVAQEQANRRRHLERTVEERTAKLQELVGELEHFSYTITHDMRAPLRAMKGYGEVVNELCAECQQQEPKGFLRRIMVSADRMDALIRDALNYSRSVRQELPLELVDTGALLRGMLDSYPEFQRSKATIQIEGELPMVMGNEAGLTQCFSNLLGNAVKFVKPGQTPEIRIRAEMRVVSERISESMSEKTAAAPSPTHSLTDSLANSWVRIWVEDNGIGIPKRMLPRVFDMFSRGHNKQEGTGIGLALVRKVMERMGGNVGVESEEGKGSRFWLELKPGDVRATRNSDVGA